MKTIDHEVCKPLLICLFLCGFMLCECAADPVAATNQQQAESGQASPGQIAAGGNTAPSRDELQRLKAWLGRKLPVRVVIVIMALSGFGIGYTVGKWRTELLYVP